MGIEIDVLALENWFDLLAFLSRGQLGQLASSIGNRRFATIVQSFLHKYVRQITLRSINVLETTNENAKDHPKARVNLWQKYRWGREEFPVADWPMPENITDFESLQLSYLDYSVLRFLQTFQQNALFTNVHLHIRTQHAGYGTKIPKFLSYLLPLVDSIDSIEFKGRELIDIIIYKDYKDGCFYFTREQLAAYSQMVTNMLNQARLIEISDHCTGRHQLDWLCHWLYTARDDRKAKCLLLLGEYISPLYLASVVESVKRDFLMAKQAVSYFIGIQSEHRDWPGNIPYIPFESLTNSRTNERMTCKKGRLLNPNLWPNEPALVLISRHPLNAVQEWIDGNEKEIMERKIHKRSRRIEFDGFQCGIGPMKRPNLITKLLENLKPTRPAPTLMHNFGKRLIGLPIG